MNILKIAAVEENQLDDLSGIQIACEQNPEFGIPMLVAAGIWWVRLPLPSSLQAVNVYLLEDGNGLTLVDTGVKTADCREALDTALKHPAVAAHQLNRIIVTHFHPDHMGLAGDLVCDDVALWTSRTAWLNCQLLSGNKQLLPVPSEVTFMQRAGLTGIELEAFRRHAVNRYSSTVSPPPDYYVPLVHGQTLKIGQRIWRVVASYGHAAEHISLWSEDCVISGDQILPNISSNLTVPYTEHDIDVIGEWLRSCRDLMRIANNQTLCLPGHQRPFYGIRHRLAQVDENVRRTLVRLQTITTQPMAAIDCVEQVYGRTFTNDERRMMLPEVVGMLNHLYFHGLVDRSLDDQGVFRFTAFDAKRGRWGERKRGKNDLVTQKIDEKGFAADHPPANHAIEFEDAASIDLFGSKEESGDFKNAISVRKTRFAAMAVIVLILALIFWQRSTAKEILQLASQHYLQIGTGVDEVEPSKPELITVDTIELVKRSQVQMPRYFTGVVKPRRISQIGFNRVGIINEILVDRGEQVEADSVLARLDTKLLQANFKAIKAQYNAANARLAELVAGPRAQTIRRAQAQVASARAESELARKSLARVQRLIGIGAVSQQDVDNAQTDLAAKTSTQKSAENALDELLEGTRSEQVTAQRAQLSELEATLEQIQVQLEESVLRAPFTATVSDRFAEAGAVASPGSPAFRLVDSESPEVWIGVPSQFVSTVPRSKQAELTINNQVYRATVKTILPELDDVTRTNTVIFSLTGSGFDSTLFGQVAEIELAREFESEGFWVPTSALVEGDHGLWAVLSVESVEDDNQGVLSRRDVEVVQVDSERAFVRGTLDSGTKIVSRGAQRLTPGQSVNLKSNAAQVEEESVAMGAAAELPGDAR